MHQEVHYDFLLHHGVTRMTLALLPSSKLPAVVSSRIPTISLNHPPRLTRFSRTCLTPEQSTVLAGNTRRFQRRRKHMAEAAMRKVHRPELRFPSSCELISGLASVSQTTTSCVQRCAHAGRPVPRVHTPENGICHASIADQSDGDHVAGNEMIEIRSPVQLSDQHHTITCHTKVR